MAMYDLKCYDNETKNTAADIVRSISPSLDYNNGFKHSGSRLQKTNPPLIQKEKTTHGYWLTPTGIKVCELLAPEK